MVALILVNRSIAQYAPIPPQRWSGIIAAPSSIEGFSMTDDTVVFDAMRFNIRIGQYVWTRRVGTPEAIQRDGLFIAGLPQYCPHEWLNEKGYVDSELARKHPYPPTKSAGA